MNPASSTNVYQFKITLKHTKPKIWRRVQVPDEYNFGDLHEVIQEAMGWHSCHLHQFEIFNPVTGQKDRISTPDSYFPDTIFEKEAKIVQYFLSPKDKASYEYDFGDGWEHEIMLEKILPAVLDDQYPKCLAGKRACPPEDCGGVWGYEELLKIIANPDHAEHEDRMEWLEGVTGGDFDPAAFDPKSVVFGNPVNQCTTQ